MFTSTFSPRVFSLIFAVVYTLDITFNWPMFRYYPFLGRFAWGDLSTYPNAPSPLGPSMQWFGWMGWAFVAALVAAAIIPKKIGNRIPGVVFFIVPIIIMAGAYIREKEFILPVGG